MKSGPRTSSRMAQRSVDCRGHERFRFVSRSVLAAIPLVVIWVAAIASAEDWPMWRYDAARSARTPQALPESLHLLWVR